MRKNPSIFFLLTIVFTGILLPLSAANYRPETSVAGFFDLEGSGREVFNFNVGWRFHRGEVAGAENSAFDDSAWEIVSVPHTPELTPAEASGQRTYQGVAWYRKSYTLDPEMEGKRVSLHFEAVMGRTQIYIDGKLVKEHFGGYLPFTVDLTELGVDTGDGFTVAVMTDNSDDPTYPPGKSQRTLDFTYHGGIYRDVWMIATGPVCVTDANEAGKIAGGGIFVHYDNITERSADVYIDTDVVNRSERRQTVSVESVILDPAGLLKAKKVNKITLKPGESRQVKQVATVNNSDLWEPDAPHLYRLVTRIVDRNGVSLDGGITRIGIRKTEFFPDKGFYLNGKPFGQLIGTNRHQDFAYVGNAVPNSQHWRDAKKIREAGCRIIRVAHYPQDPSFMDACDELGIFVIVACPGWQFWNEDPVFVNRTYEDVRQMIRRDRNHPCVIMWEPVLNETPFPASYAEEVYRITHEEYPYPGCYAAADNYSLGVEGLYDVVYGWPNDVVEKDLKENIFTREFGENVDDWYAQNTNNRASRSWGETALVEQAMQLSRAYNELYRYQGQFIGGAQWHAFDHQRGYHPDPYWGGQWDAFRQPKYAFYMFKSQIAPDVVHPFVETGPMAFIAHEIGAFSGRDVVVFSNCDSVRLQVYEDGPIVTLPVVKDDFMPYSPVVFKDVYDFNEMRIRTYVEKKPEKVYLIAEGIIGGEVVVTTVKRPSRRSNHLRLTLEHEGQQLVADGSDFAVVIAEVIDDDGNVKRLAKDRILFSVEGEGEIIGNAAIGANPREVEFGSAPVLIRATTRPGKIKVSARVLWEGEQAATPAVIEFETIPPSRPLLYSELPSLSAGALDEEITGKAALNRISEEQRQRELMEVEQQQTDFGEKFE